MMGHTDVVNVDPAKWTFPPFSATRDGGYIYGRGTVDDKDNVAAALMTMLLLKRSTVPLARDVIFLAEAGEEGTTRVGIQFMVKQHFAEIEAEYCLAEGGERAAKRWPRALCVGGDRREDSSRDSTDGDRHGGPWLGTARDERGPHAVAGDYRGRRRGSRRFSSAKPPAPTLRGSPRSRRPPRPRGTVRSSATIPRPRRTPSIISRRATRASRRCVRNSISPTIIQGGYRVNVIPSEARATLDVRLMSGQDPAAFLVELRKVINDPAVRVEWIPRDVRPATPSARLDTEVFKVLESAYARFYDTTVLPTLSTGATDMSYLREKGIQCYGVGPALDRKTVRRDSARTAIRSGFSRPSCTSSSASTTRSCAIWRVPTRTT